ncbi:MAG: histidine kinase [Verrucomicrobiales bacterium]|nr:histidine kinase [Verrucomicrobiales bacterium]
MVKPVKKIVAKKKLIGFSKEALAELKRKKNDAGSGATETSIIEDLILEREKFNPFVEDAIRLHQAKRGMSREEAIDFFLTKGVVSSITLEGGDLKAMKEASISPRIPAWVKRLSEPVIFTDSQAITTWVNPAFENMCGYSISELKGKNPGPILQGDGSTVKARRALRHAIESRTPAGVRIVNYKKEGQPYIVHIQLAPTGTGFVAVEKVLTSTDGDPGNELLPLLARIVAAC